MPSLNPKIIVYLVVGAAILLVGLQSLKTASSVGAGQASRMGAGSQASDTSASLKVSGADRRLIVDVAGAVRRPGVYRFTHGARIMDAIKRAGGLSGHALPAAINRAATLSDGQQVVVPSTRPSVHAGQAGTGAGVADAPVSLGTATQEQLEEIDGIGPVTAEKILEFRDSQGGLSSVDQLDEVSGIGPVTMESLRTALAP